jgi:hypothetical protein
MERLLTVVIGVCFCVMILTMGSCTAHQNSRLERMVRNGADPISSGCALGIRTNEALCALAVSKKK